MSTLVQISVLPEKVEDDDYIAELAFKKARLRADDVREWDIRKRSIDARKEPVKILLQIEFWKNDEEREAERGRHRIPRLGRGGGGRGKE